MTEDDLKEEINKVNESLEKLPADGKPITKKEKKEKNLLLLKQTVLLRIKDAREKEHRQAEFDSTVFYGVLNSWIGNHPFLMHLVVNARCRGSAV